MNSKVENNGLNKKENDERCRKKCRNVVNNSEETYVPSNDDDSSIKTEWIKTRLDQTISNDARKKILNLLDEVGQLSDLEKLFLYVQLPTGTTPIIDPPRQRYLSNPLGKKGDIEIAQTYTWIQSHLEEDQDISLPKHEVYEEYRNFFEASKLDPLCAADFGKIMKHVFPSVKPRRLGTRGNSRYCYSGLKKKENIKPPSLLDFNIGDLYDGFRSNETNEVDNAACHIVFEWAEKLLSKKFLSIKELAMHLVENLYIGTPSVTALSLLTSSSCRSKDAGISSNSLYKPTNAKKRKQSQVQPQKKKHKMPCIDNASLKTENRVSATLQQSDFQNRELKIPNTHNKTASLDTRNTLPVGELLGNSHGSSVVPSTSQVPFSAIEIGTKIFHPSSVATDGTRKEIENSVYEENIAKDAQIFLRSKSLEFKKLDYETAIYNIFNQCDTVGDENLSFKKEDSLFDPTKHSAEANAKQLRIDSFDSGFNSNCVPSVHNFQTSNITTGVLSSKIDTVQTDIQPESSTSQNSRNIQATNNRSKKTDMSQLSHLRMLLEKNLLAPVNKSKTVDIDRNQLVLPNCNPIALLNEENKAETLKPFSDIEERWKKNNFHSTKLSLMAETYNRSVGLSKDVQELNNEKAHFNSALLLPNNNLLPQKVPPLETIPDMSLQPKSFDFVPVSIKEANGQHNVDASDPSQISNEIFSPVLINTQETLASSALHKNPKEIYQNYDLPNLPFPFLQEALSSPGRPRHHSSHSIGQAHNKPAQGMKDYNRFLLGSRSRHLSGPTYSKRDVSYETRACNGSLVTGNEIIQFQDTFAPANFHQDSFYAQGMLNKASPSFIYAESHSSSAEKMQANSSRPCDSNPLLIPNQESANFSQNFQQSYPVKQSNLYPNRCQSVPPHKMLQMLIDQNSPVHSPAISKSYPTTPVVNQIFQFPVSQTYRYEPQMESGKLLTENDRDVPELLMEGWHSSGNDACHSSMPELLEQPLDELQTTLEDLRDCDEFAQHLESIDKK